MYVSLNGILVQEEHGKIKAMTEGFMYGYGLFETIKVIQSKMMYLDEHMDRMTKGMHKLGLVMSYSKDQLINYAQALIIANNILDGSIKIMYAKNGEWGDLIMSTNLNKYTKEKYERGFHICLCETRRNPHSKLTYIKSNNYMENVLEKLKSNKKGYDEAIYLNIYEDLSEGTFTNVFFIKNRIVYTPSINSGILPGIMRKKVIELVKGMNIPVEVGEYKVECLLQADEVFLTNSLMEIMPVTKIEDRKLDIKSNGITTLLREKFK